ncbi:hypothetical protein Droror1_Dr00002577 [Drosera rotundifolia]
MISSLILKCSVPNLPVSKVRGLQKIKMELSLTRPDDWHLHVRDGDLLEAVAPLSARHFGRAVVMPNLRPPITTTAAAAYRESIMKALPEDSNFTPLMTLYLTDRTSPDEIKLARESGVVYAVKLYPAGATTNSQDGVTDLFGKCFPVLQEMVQQNMPLLAGALDKFEAFTSFNGPDFYGLPRSTSTIKLSRTPWKRRQYHDGRPRGPLWRGKKLIGKEALFAIPGLKRFKENDEKAELFVRSHVLRLLKMDLIAVLTELERQEEVELALKVFKVIQKQDWYKPDPYLYKDLIIVLSKCKKMEEVAKMWEDMKKEELFPDSLTYTEVIRGYLKYGSPSDAMNIYEDMLKSPDPPDELPFKVLLRGLLPHPLLRNKVKKDYQEIFPESRVYDPPSEIFSFAESNA